MRYVMNIEILKKIGKRLLAEIPLMKRGPLGDSAIGIGASGDMTFPIDKKAEEIILSCLYESGGAFTVVSEEIGIQEIKGGGKKIIIDPIDGTKNATAGIPFYCTSIAVADGDRIGDIELAYVVNLANGDEFWAERGKGAFLYDKKIQTQQDEELYLTAYEAQSPRNDIPLILPLLSHSRKSRCLGATALDLGYLACGSISVFVCPSPSRVFDFAGGWLLVREAGGIFTDMKGNPISDLKISLKESSSLLVSGNERLHGIALRLLGGV